MSVFTPVVDVVVASTGTSGGGGTGGGEVDVRVPADSLTRSSQGWGVQQPHRAYSTLVGARAPVQHLLLESEL